MFAGWKLSTKIAVGFALMVAIAAALGGKAAHSMRSVKLFAEDLSKDEMVKMEFAQELEGFTNQTMFEIRGYVMTQDKKYLDQGLKAFENVKKKLTEFQAYAKTGDDSEVIAKLDQTQETVKVWEGLLQETSDGIEKMTALRKELNANAATITEQANNYLQSQRSKLKSEIDSKQPIKKIEERTHKIDLITDAYLKIMGARTLVWRSFFDKDGAQLTEAVKNLDAVDQLFATLLPITTQEINIKEIKNIREATENYKKIVQQYIEMMDKMKGIDAKRLELAEKVADAADVLGTYQVKTVHTRSDEILSSVSTGLMVIIIGLLSAMLAGAVLATFITSMISRPLKQAIDGMRSATVQVDGASTQLSNAAQQLSQSANEQASAIEETSASLEEMGGMVQNNVANAQKSSETSTEMRQLSEHGNSSMERLQKSMGEILASNEKIVQLVKVIAEIGEKTKVMDEIVFQTKLLSFNASVEAERAGEHGRGFAVVAQEVGNLAQMSGKAAQEISQIVSSSIKTAEEITVENKRKVEEGHIYVSETGKFLRDIMKSSGSVADGSSQVLSASREQASGIKQINAAMSNLDKATQENASLAEETAATSEELNAQTASLTAYVDALAVLVDGHSAQESTRSTHPTTTGQSTKSRPALSILKSTSSRGEKASNGDFKASVKSFKTPVKQPMKMAAGSELGGVDNGDDGWDKL